MPTIEDVQKRFQKIASDWGLEAAGVKERLNAVAGWLGGGSRDPAVVLQATQILLIDPEHSTARRRPVFVGAIQHLGDTWLDPGARDVCLLQAMLLAAGIPENSAVAGLASAGWEVLQGRDAQWKALESWSWIGTQLQANDLLNRSLEECMKDENIEFEEISTEDLLDAMFSLDGKISASRPHELELLWWGQARYCHTQRSPYRRLFKDPAQRDLSFVHACMEAAERAKTLDPEPAAAFLIETLDDIGWDVDERRPIRAWMDNTTAALKTAGSAPALCQALHALATRDCLGLPATRARLTARGVPEQADVPALSDAETLEIDRGQWATWLFKEQILNLRMSP